MSVESKNLEDLAREALVHKIAHDAVEKDKPIIEVIVETISWLAKGTIPPSERVQKLPSMEDFKKHIEQIRNKDS